MNNTPTTTITPIVSGLKSRAIAKTRARMTIRKTSSSSSQIEVKAEELSKLDPCLGLQGKLRTTGTLTLPGATHA